MTPPDPATGEIRSGAPPWTVLASRTVFLSLGLLVALEIVLRVIAAGPGGREFLPPSRVYYSNHVEPRLRALEATVDEHGGVDVLFVGSSIVRTNFRPLVFDSVVESETNRHVVSFNGGLSGLPPAGVRLYLERFFLPRIRPTTVFQGIRYPELLRTEPAEAVGPLGSGMVEGLWMQPNPWNRARSWALENVALLHYRGLLGRSLRARRFPPPLPATYPIDERGWHRRDTTLTQRISLGDAVPLKLHPEEADPRELERGISLLRSTAEAVRDRGMEYVLVNVPENDEVHGGVEGSDRYRAYVERLENLADEAGIRFIDPTGGDPSAFDDDRWYYDGHHMTAEGALRFTREVAREWASSPGAP